MPDPVMDENAATAELATRNINFLLRAANGSHNDFTRCREAGNALAAAIAALPESEAKTALYPAYETYMSLDAGNFGPPYPGSEQPVAADG